MGFNVVLQTIFAFSRRKMHVSINEIIVHCKMKALHLIKEIVATD